MPIYEFKCDCGTKFEHLFRNELPIEFWTCPKCKKMAKKIMSSVHNSFDFKAVEPLTEQVQSGKLKAL